MKGGERNAAPDSRAVQTKVRELRSVSFSAARRGLDRDEVMTYLHRLAAWLESAGLADPEEVRRELAMVGQRTSEILTKADETANALRSESQRNAGELLQSARSEADRIRAEAEEETRDAVVEAKARAEETLEEADRRAERMIDEAVKRRGDLEVVIDDLVAGRDEILADTRRLVDELGALVGRDDDKRPEDDEEAGELEPTEEGAPDERVSTLAEIDDDELTGELDGAPDFSARDRVEEFEDDEPAGGEPEDLAEPDTEEHSPERASPGSP
jgi:F0F1-type ATP synthase membrane subunit b/b'